MSYLVANPEDRFSRDEAHLICDFQDKIYVSFLFCFFNLLSLQVTKTD